MDTVGPCLILHHICTALPFSLRTCFHLTSPSYSEHLLPSWSREPSLPSQSSSSSADISPISPATWFHQVAPHTCHPGHSHPLTKHYTAATINRDLIAWFTPGHSSPSNWNPPLPKFTDILLRPNRASSNSFRSISCRVLSPVNFMQRSYRQPTTLFTPPYT